MRISDWSSDVCSSDLLHLHLVDVAGVEIADRALDEVGFLVDQAGRGRPQRGLADVVPQPQQILVVALDLGLGALAAGGPHDHCHALRHVQTLDDLLEALAVAGMRSEEHTSELQSLMRISYAVFCL